jgi:hypothetical protein
MGDYMKRNLLVILLLLVLGITGVVKTQANWNIELTGEGLLDLQSETLDAMRIDDYLIIATSDLLVLDVSDPLSPEHLSTIFEFETSDIITHIDGILYSRSRNPETDNYELYVHDISDIYNSVVIGSNSDHDDWEWVTYGNGYLFASIDGEPRCEVYDIQNNYVFPDLVATILLDDNVRSIATDNDILAIQTRDDIILYSIANPLIPLHLSTMNLNDLSSHETMIISGAVLYYMNNDTLLTIDVSDPVNPEVVTEFYVGFPAVTFSIAGNYMAITSPVNDMKILDISNPLDPFYVSSLPVRKYYSTAISENPNIFYAYRGLDTWIDIIEASETPQVIVGLGQNARIARTEAYNDATYSSIIDGTGDWPALYISDFRESSTPVETQVLGDKDIIRIDTMDEYLITKERIATGGPWYIQIYDMNNPHEPQEVITLPIHNFGDIRISDHYLFVDQSEYYVLDIENPSNPVRIYGIGRDYYDIDGTTVIAIRFMGNGPQMVRYEMEGTITAVDTIDTHWYDGSMIEDDIMIITYEEEETRIFHMIDISHPTQMINGPDLRINPEGNRRRVHDYELSQDHLFLLFESGLLEIYEVANGLADPVLAGEYELNPDGMGISICGPNAYAVSSNNMYQLDISEALNFNAQPDIVIELRVLNSPPIIPPSGGTIEFDAYVANSLENPQLVQAWLTVTAPDNSTLNGSPINFTLQPGELTGRNGIVLYVPPESESGLYTVTANLGVYPDQVVAESNFQFYKSAGQLSASFASGLIEWAIIGWSFDDDVEHLRQSTISGDYIAAPDPVLPDEFFLTAYPNPFNERATISLSLPETGEVRVQVYDVTGRVVTTLRDGVLNAGVHRLEWDATGQASGVYFLSVTHTDGEQTVRKLALVR